MLWKASFIFHTISFEVYSKTIQCDLKELILLQNKETNLAVRVNTSSITIQFSSSIT